MLLLLSVKEICTCTVDGSSGSFVALAGRITSISLLEIDTMSTRGTIAAPNLMVILAKLAEFLSTGKPVPEILIELPPYPLPIVGETELMETGKSYAPVALLVST